MKSLYTGYLIYKMDISTHTYYNELFFSDSAVLLVKSQFCRAHSATHCLCLGAQTLPPVDRHSSIDRTFLSLYSHIVAADSNLIQS